MNHVYLSPHLDDAIFSCGGLIQQQRLAGEGVTVVNLCAGIPDYTQLSPFARTYHAKWGDPPDLVAVRRIEDRAVLDAQGVSSYYGDTPDSIYRRVNGAIAYPDLGALFSTPHPDELQILPGIWQRELESLISDPGATVLYAPLAAVGHVDHQLVRVLGKHMSDAGSQVWFYEDFPHVMRAGPDALQSALDWFRPALWRSQTVAINVNAKIGAMQGYRSQMSSTFRDEQAMALEVRRFTADTARGISAGERLRYRLASSSGRRERAWRAVLGYHAHAERIWRPA